MAIENTYRDSPEILQVSDVSQKYHREFDTVIITFASNVLSGLLEQNLISELPDCMLGTCHGKYPIYQLNQNPNVLFYLSPIGSPTTVGILEEIVYSMNIKNIILYGSCGVLDRSITHGKVIVPTKAYRDEGTSYHYASASDFIDIDNHHLAAKVFDNLNVDYVKGYTWTTDAFYRETKDIFIERKNQGCIAVEMEISAVQAFANYRRVNLYAFIYGADNLDSTKWDKRILGNLDISGRIKYFLLATEIASYISK